MRIGIVGSRRRTDRDAVVRLVNSLKQSDTVVSGGCRGVDTWAVQAARARHMNTDEYLPLISPGMSRDEVVQAYYDRNRRVVENCDMLYAFVAPDRTGGTENTLKQARELGVLAAAMPQAEEVDETGDGDADETD